MKKMFNLKNLFAACLVLTVCLTLSLSAVNAQSPTPQLLGSDSQQQLDAQNKAFLDASGLGTNYSLGRMISLILAVLFSFLGVLFFLLILYAGYLWMVSAGNEEKVQKAKDIMKAAVIGLVIVLMAYAITYFIIDKVLEATNGGAGLD